jgi:hypothetical protein
MLSKLIKYDLKATSRLLIPLYLILMVMSVVNRIVLSFNDYKPVSIFSQFLIVIYIMSIVTVFAVTVIYMIARFYKNLLADEGYLMFTLPVKTHELIASKLLSTIFWTLASVAVVGISLLIAFVTPESIPVSVNAIKEGIAELNREIGGNWPLMFFELIIMILLGLVGNILIIYVSIAIGQLFSKYRIMASFGAYMVIYTVLQFLMIIPLAVFGVMFRGWTPQVSDIPLIIFPGIIVVLSIGCAGFYYATHYIFKRKLNLE